MFPLVLVAALSVAPVPAPKAEPLPPGAILRLGSARFRMPNLSQSIVTRDGTQLITVSAQTKLIKVWDLTAGTVVREMTFSAPIDFRNGFAWAPDGKTFATMGRDANSPQRDAGIITIHDATSGNSIRPIPIKYTQYASDSGLQYLPDDKRIFALLNKSYAVFDVETGKELASQPYHRDQYGGAGLSPDGTRVIVLDMYDNVAQVWDWGSGQPARSFRLAPSFRPGAATFAPDNKRVAIASEHGGPILLCDTDAGTVIREFRHPTRTRWFRSLVFSPNGTSLLANDDGGVNMSNGQDPPGVLEFEIATGKPLKKWPSPIPVGHLTLTADRKTIVAQENAFMSNSSGFPRWDALTGERTNADDPNLGVVVHNVHTGQGLILTTTHERGHRPRLWNAETGKLLHTLDHERCYRAVAFSSDGKTVVTGAGDDRIKVWDTATGTLKMSLPGHGNMNGVTAVGLSPDNQRLVSFGMDFFLRTTDLKTGKAIREFAIRPPGLDVPSDTFDDITKDNTGSGQSRMLLLSISAAAVAANSQVLTLSTQNTHFVCNTDTGTMRQSWKVAQTGFSTFTISDDGRWAQTLDTTPGLPVKMPNGQTRYEPAKMHPLRGWDVGAGQRAWEVAVPSRFSGRLVGSPDGKWLAFPGVDEGDKLTIEFHSTSTGAYAGRIKDIPGDCFNITFTADGKRVVLAMSDQTALVYPVPALDPR